MHELQRYLTVTLSIVPLRNVVLPASVNNIRPYVCHRQTRSDLKLPTTTTLTSKRNKSGPIRIREGEHHGQADGGWASSQGYTQNLMKISFKL